MERIHEGNLIGLNELADEFERKARARGDEIVYVQPGEPIESKPGTVTVVLIPPVQ